MKIISTAPTRIGIIGGGTDVNPFAFEYGGKVLSMAISLPHEVTLIPRDDKNIIVNALGETRSYEVGGKLSYQEDHKFDLIKSILNHFCSYIHQGFELTIIFKGLSTSGLGTSASVAVAIIGTLNVWLNLQLTRYQIAILAWELENNELGWLSGKQDQLAAAFGGLNLLYFGPGDKVGVESQDFLPKSIQKFRDWCLLFFIRQTRNSGDIQKQLVHKMDHFQKQKALFALRDSVDEAVHHLQTGDIYSLGKLVDEVWLNKKKSNPQASNQVIDSIYETAIRCGALGGKVMGAGGGGHMYFICPPEKQPELKLALANRADELTFDIDKNGLSVKTIL